MQKLISIVVILAIALIFALLVVTHLLGRGFDTDLSRVGQGEPALVLAFENFSPAGMDAMELLNAVRGDYQDRIVFLVADLGVPEGQAFAERHGIRDGMAVFVDGEGRAVNQYSVSGDAGALRRQLDADLRAALTAP